MHPFLSRNYEHQADADGRPVPVGPELLQRHDEVVKRFNENKTQTQVRNKAARKGGVGVNASMIVVDQEEGDTYLSCSATQASEMVDSGTNAVIVPLHPDMW